jgi:hypothetical protein
MVEISSWKILDHMMLSQFSQLNQDVLNAMKSIKNSKALPTHSKLQNQI